MCGISGIINHPEAAQLIEKMTGAQTHRGPDATGYYISENKQVALGHNRLSIIDLSSAGNQPFYSDDNRYTMVFNGEVYNYTEIKTELKSGYTFKTQTDTEVVLAAWLKWGEKCLDKFIGMFAFAIWDNQTQTLFAARDRFGVKPFHYCIVNNTFVFASEIKAIHATGIINKTPNLSIWSTYLHNGLYDYNEQTFWEGINKLPAGHFLTHTPQQTTITCWYNLADKIKLDTRSNAAVQDELLFLLEDAIKLRFRADVPVGVCLSGGLDSSLLLALVQRVKGNDFPIHAFTFYTGDAQYDELPWVEQLVKNTAVIHHACKLQVDEIPQLANYISNKMDEPYGGIPTLGMSKVFEKAASLGIKVLLDGNGMDEAWGGYDYYRKIASIDLSKGPVQGASTMLSLTDCTTQLLKDAQNTIPKFAFHPDPLINIQLRDILVSKIPRSMRFADRNSMAYSVELREPFLDHRIVELGLNQPIAHKINGDTGKYLVRQLANKIIPNKISEAPKRAVQTPQREWLADDLAPWINQLIAENNSNQFFNSQEMLNTYKLYQKNKPDNSFYIWQLINTLLLIK